MPVFKFIRKLGFKDQSGSSEVTLPGVALVLPGNQTARWQQEVISSALSFQRWHAAAACSLRIRLNERCSGNKSKIIPSQIPDELTRCSLWGSSNAVGKRKQLQAERRYHAVFDKILIHWTSINTVGILTNKEKHPHTYCCQFFAKYTLKKL